MFLDAATIEVRGGAGGCGCVSWRREKYEPMGGPNGGDGGRGGTIILLADENTDTLSNFATTKRFAAPKGIFGKGKEMGGHDGEDLVLRVPPGTIVYEVEPDGKNQKSIINNQKSIGELLRHGDQLLVAHGGRGGYGNAHFKSATRQRPDFAELGEPGEKKHLHLELKLVADVGIIGYPSVGKSMLISVISGARPKIAAYPFTTLIPNLGVVTVGGRPAGRSLGGGRSYIVCDVPGLIEGASEGKGLGQTFLRHIERCGVLLHLLDIERAFEGGVISGEPNPELLMKDYEAIRKELEAYSPALAKKKELIVLNKVDLIGNDPSAMERALNKHKLKVFASISAITKFGTVDLTKKLLPIVLKERTKRDSSTEEKSIILPVLKPHLDAPRMGAYHVKKLDDQILVTGKRLEQFTLMTDFSSEGAVRRFRDVIERIGLVAAIKRARKEEDLPVFIGNARIDNYL